MSTDVRFSRWDRLTSGPPARRIQRRSLKSVFMVSIDDVRELARRYNWVHTRLSALAPDEMRELVIDAWTMVVPKSVAGAYLETHL